MTQVCSQITFQCPICLSALLKPVTLPCGHNYCEPCVKNKSFRLTSPLCPICRKQINIHPRQLSVNLLLDHILCEQFRHQQNYQKRLSAYLGFLQKQQNINILVKIYRRTIKILKRAFKFVSDNTKFITLILVLFFLFKKVRINVFNVEMSEQIKNKALKVVNKVKDEATLDFKFLMFSQLLRMLFSNMIIR